ncbi:MAG: peptidase T [Planctomycetota bacterium]|jgi:tripeptide aminopeptidase
MESVLDRFLRYVKVDTQSDENSDAYPSTQKQFDLCRMLADECRELGLDNVDVSEFGVVTATVPANVDHDAPAIALIAHVDTSPEFSGTDVKPVLHENYDGSDITLPGDSSRVIRVAENEALKTLVGGTIVTTDGTTLLGADDKAGVAAIMAAASRLMADSSIPRGPVRLVFTCDEEIGRGVDKVDIDGLNAVCGYTLDGEGVGKVDCETFSADLAVVTVEGINTHPSEGKDRMVNSLRIISQFIARLPTDHLSPETTDGRDGFMHPYVLEGGVARATTKIILREFDTEKLADQAALLGSIADDLRAEHPKAKITVEIRKQYRNLGDGLKSEPRALPKAEAAMKACGITPELSIIRGGTDGSILTERGLPTPNLSTGEHNPHSPLEWTSKEELETAVSVLVELVRGWSSERV